MDDFDKLIALFSKLPEERQRLLLEQLERENNGATDSERNSSFPGNDSGKVITGSFPAKTPPKT